MRVLQLCLEERMVKVIFYISDYIGCFIDYRQRLLSSHMEDWGHMTNTMCIHTCQNLGFLYAGTQVNVSIHVRVMLLVQGG